MKKTPYSDYKGGGIQGQLDGIPFFNDLAINAPDQKSLLLDHSSIVELKPGDVLIKKGEVDNTFYFLLKGELAVYGTEKITRKSEPVSALSTGSVLGALAAMTRLPRTATVAVEKSGSPAQLFATDFSAFGELEDFSTISLATKLAFYRIVINNTRFKLEGYKNRDKSHPLAQIYDKIKKYGGDKDTLDELKYHAKQAMMLARVLEKWNAIQ